MTTASYGTFSRGRTTIASSLGDRFAVISVSQASSESIGASTRVGMLEAERVVTRTSLPSLEVSSSSTRVRCSGTFTIEGFDGGSAVFSSHSGPSTLALAIKNTRITITTSTMGVMFGA
ncbi:MAG: hypothetical protein KF691_15395 [Phycisphaeraceae bacterium]|nr:hypothetical protein [Phycisphaeraceae bacterium]